MRTSYFRRCAARSVATESGRESVSRRAVAMVARNAQTGARGLATTSVGVMGHEFLHHATELWNGLSDLSS